MLPFVEFSKMQCYRDYGGTYYLPSTYTPDPARLRVSVVCDPAVACARGMSGLVEGVVSHPKTCLSDADPHVVLVCARATTPMDFSAMCPVGARLFLVDFMDEPNVPVEKPRGVAFVFKRSIVELDGHVHTRPWLKHFPYCVRASMPVTHPTQERPLNVVCSLSRDNIRPSAGPLLQALSDRCFAPSSVGRTLPGRFAASEEYSATNASAKVVVTMHPDLWEGDFRTWEAFASGACVVLARTKAPYDHPLVDGVHCVKFSKDKPEEVHAIVARLLVNQKERVAIANAGQTHVLTHHSATARIDAIVAQYYSCVVPRPTRPPLL